MVQTNVGWIVLVLAICRCCPARHLLAANAQAKRNKVMGTLDILEHDKYFNALFSLPFQQPVEAILRQAGPAQAELCPTLTPSRNRGDLTVNTTNLATATNRGYRSCLSREASHVISSRSSLADLVENNTLAPAGQRTHAIHKPLR
jgi:hypothetical protein